MLVATANAEIAKTFIASVLKREGIETGQAVVHANRGTEMTAYPVCMLLDKLGVARSYSRPRVTNDNPYSEAAFKTLKYQPTFPERLGSTVDASVFFGSYFDWYNNVHRHSGIRMLPPAAVHHGLAADLLEKRYAAMQRAYAAHPDRFAADSPPRVPLPSEVWINRPSHGGPAAA